MKCKKVKKWLPLLAGLDLSQKEIFDIKIHLERCSRCQQEYESYLLSVGKIKEWLAKSKMDWKDSEWQTAIRKTIEERPARVSPLVPWPFKRSWAFALMAVSVIVLTLFVVRPYRDGFGEGKETEYVSWGIPSEVSTDKPQQQVVSMTWVSKETGLKIAWFFNKDFDFKEVK